MKICMTRHGETDWNAKGILQGHEGPRKSTGTQTS